MNLEPFDDFLVGKAASQVGPPNEVLSVAREMAVSVHEAGIDSFALGIDGLGGSVMAHDVVIIAHSDEYPVFYGESFGLGELFIDGIDVGVVDDEIHGGFGGARGHQ